MSRTVRSSCARSPRTSTRCSSTANPASRLATSSDSTAGNSSTRRPPPWTISSGASACRWHDPTRGRQPRRYERLDEPLRGSRAAGVDRLQVVLPFARGLCELVHELEAVGPELRVGTLVESGVVPPPAHDELLRRDPVCPAYNARVEVLQDQPLAGLSGADDVDC